MGLRVPAGEHRPNAWGVLRVLPDAGRGTISSDRQRPEELEGKEQITADDVQEVLDRRSGLETRITVVHWTSVYRTTAE